MTELNRRQFAATALVLGVPCVEVAAAEEKADPSEALLEVVKARYDKHLNAAKRKRILAAIRGNLASAERLAKMKLTNADEPAVVFSADVPG